MNRHPRPAAGRRHKLQPDNSKAPSQAAYRIGEAARMVGVKPYVLRFWETQFSFLRRAHAASKHRIYAVKDIENLKMIKRLLHEERFTIEGARKHLRTQGIERVQQALAEGSARRPPAASVQMQPTSDSMRTALREIRTGLESLQKLLGD